MAGITKHYKNLINEYKVFMTCNVDGVRGPSGKENGRQLKKIWKNYYILKISEQKLLSSKHLISAS